MPHQKTTATTCHMKICLTPWVNNVFEVWGSWLRLGGSWTFWISLSIFSGEAIWTWWFSTHEKSRIPQNHRKDLVFDMLWSKCVAIFFSSPKLKQTKGVHCDSVAGAIAIVHDTWYPYKWTPSPMCGQMKLCHQLEIATSWNNGRIAHINLLINTILQSSQHTCYLIRHGFAMFSCHNHCLKSLFVVQSTISLTENIYLLSQHRSTHREDSARCFATQTYSPRPYRTPSDGHIRPHRKKWFEENCGKGYFVYIYIYLWIVYSSYLMETYTTTHQVTTPLLEATF